MAGESFVDVRYLGLELGRRLKMHEFGPETAYLEHATPMPVGAPLEIETDAGVRLSATVIRVCEQVAGAERPPGMRVRCGELDEPARAWWQELVTVDDPAVAAIPDEEVAAVATGVGGAEEAADAAGDDAPAGGGDADGTAEAEAAGPAAGEEAAGPAAGAEAAGPAAGEEAAGEKPHKGAGGPIVDDGKKTEIMSAVVVDEAAEAAPASTPGDQASAETSAAGSGKPAKAESAEASSDGEARAGDGDGDGTKKKRGRRGRRKKR